MAEKFGNTWWSERWLQSLANIDFENRLPRGASYARKGAVTKIDIKGNTIEAKVQGTHKYTVKITVPEFSAAEKRKFIDALLAQPALIASLLNHQLLPEVMTIAERLKMKVFPTSWKDFKMDCSCPDWAVPCKHLAAVIYVISREIDNDPFLVFKLHNIDILKELADRDVTIDEKTQKVPLLTELIHLAKDKNQADFDENQVYTRISYSSLPNLVEVLPEMLDDNPTFDSSANFLDYYKRQMRTLAKQADLTLCNPNKLEFGSVDPISIGKHDEVKTVVLSDNYDYSPVHASVAAIMKAAGRKVSTFPCVPWEIMRLVMCIDNEQIDKYSPNVVAMRHAVKTALMLIKNGAIVPQPYIVEKTRLMIRWLPAMLDENVSAVVEKCVQTIPPSIICFASGKKSNSGYHPIENPGYEFLVWVISRVLHRLYRYDISTEVNDLFFGENQYINLAEVGKSTIGGSINSWLNRFYLKNEDYRYVIMVEEDSDDFSLSIAVEDVQKNDGLPIALSEVLTSEHYADKRFGIMQSLTMFNKQVAGLTDYINSNAENPIRLTMNQLADFLFKSMPMLKMLGVKVLLPKSLQSIVRPKASLKVAGKESGTKGFFTLDTLLDFEWTVALGDQKISVAEFKKLLQKSEQLIKIKGQYIYLSESDIAKLMETIEKGAPTQMQLMQAAIAEEYDGERIELSAELKKQIDALRKLDKVDVPAEINATLRPYQQSGYWWMYRNSKLGLGSIIADDMGLGKTLQVITLLQKLKNEKVVNEKTPAVIVVPTALLFNWTKEIEHFAPQLSSSIFHGTARDLSNCKTDIVLTTYGVSRTDKDKLKKLKPSVLVIDEAQNIKNAQTEQTKAVKSIAAPIKIAMSGTPVENRMSEFWSIMDFTNKGFLGTAKAFNTDFAMPIQNDGNEQVAERFRKITAPFMMRRLKTDKSIISDLPDKIETNEYATLTKEQASLYEKTVQEAMKAIEDIGETDSKSLFKRSALVLQMMLSLKQICNHPTQFLKNGVMDASLSGKTEMLFSLLDTITENNEKVLVFTQFAEMGEMLCKFIAEHFDEQPMFYHGGCSVKEREQMIDRFQNNHSDRIFVLTIKSAGVGLNLTAATHVIHYDLWWNPAVEAQATDRAYRIGQKHNVQVHRFITRNTFEERIDEMIQSKKHLADMTMATGENWIGKLSNEELRVIFG